MTGSKQEFSNKPIFLVQKHEASHLHYDFRLEVNKSLKSWAVPKSLSNGPKLKHLAIPVPDHALSYANFEGVIPEGQYGAGKVLTWDIGTYKNMNTNENGELISMENSYKNGKIKIWLEGKKRKGGFALIKTTIKTMKDNWLLIKTKDE
jgi:DNA ligase D-like protein (predicted 3'-phosphoesterase)